MGPTCAKRAGLAAGADVSWQLSFFEDLGAQIKPAPPRVRSRLPKRKLPTELSEGYQLAKIAFDELYSEFCGNGSLLHNASALELEREVLFEGCELHSLADPVLGWLEPEYHLQLMIVHEDQVAYHRREINGVVTMLMIEMTESASARRNIEYITFFTAAVRKYYQGPQLSLLDLGL